MKPMPHFTFNGDLFRSKFKADSWVILQQTSIFIACYECEFYGKQDSQANSFLLL